jgi:hypothetical protein
VFICLCNGADLTVEIIKRQMSNDISVTIIELVNTAEEPIVANTTNERPCSGS